MSRHIPRLTTALTRSSRHPPRRPSDVIGHPSLAAPVGRQTQTRLGSGQSHFNQPSGWLFGEKPLPKGQKRVREDWELVWYVGFWGTTFLGILMHVYKPDRSIQTWARKEAELKMGQPPTYDKS